MLRRLLFLLLAVLLPLQFSWAAVAGYCQHAEDAAPRHLGHHEHVHKADTEKSADPKLAADPDCGTCHAAGASALVGPSEAVFVLSGGQRPPPQAGPGPSSLPPDTPERPQWPRLA